MKPLPDFADSKNAMAERFYGKIYIWQIYIYIYIFFIFFFIFSQTMFASSSRYLLFKPYYFHNHWQELELSLRRFPLLRLTYYLFFTRYPVYYSIGAV